MSLPDYHTSCVSGAVIINGDKAVGIVENKVFGITDSNPKQVLLRPTATHPTMPVVLVADNLRRGHAAKSVIRRASHAVGTAA